MAFRAKWSDEQRDAIRKAAMEHGKTAPEVTRLAHGGGLPVGVPEDAKLPPFDIPASTVADLISRARRDAKAADRATRDPNVVMAETVGTLQAMLAREVERARRAQSQKRGDMPERIAKLARAAREVDTTTRAMLRNVAPPASEPDATTPSAGDDGDILAAVAREHVRQ